MQSSSPKNLLNLLKSAVSILTIQKFYFLEYDRFSQGLTDLYRASGTLFWAVFGYGEPWEWTEISNCPDLFVVEYEVSIMLVILNLKIQFNFYSVLQKFVCFFLPTC